ncbi:O-antigen ligase family protein [Niallia sp. Krafla_26]|uniref:O-antigen ligase family protein n=1 Tax=Niallia sp. Krafla_26 TaxID=3064703 RepID=UPI003D16C66D
MSKFEKILLTIFFVEVFIGGGGRLIDFGILSIRQVLFILVILTFATRIIKEKAYFNKEINTFIRINPLTIGIYGLIIWFFVSALMGIINGNPLSIIVMDFFRVSFFGVYFPLAYYISEERFTKQRIISLLKYSALAVAIFTISIAVLGKTVFSANFLPFYRFMNTIMNDDLFFRPSNSVFYKSHFYVLIGLILSLNALLSKKYTKIDIYNVILCSISILWSETRGFLVAFVVCVLMIIALDIKIVTDPIKGLVQKYKNLVKNKQLIKKSIILMIVIISVPFLYQHMTLERFQQDAVVEVPKPDDEEENKEVKKEVNDVSVNARLEFILDSKDILLSNPVLLVVGHGYGTEIAGRLNGIEMSFLDILVEQGIIGLSIWLFLCLIFLLNYHKAYKRNFNITTDDRSLIAAFIGVVVLTNINPFINNPIGITFFILVLIISQNTAELSKFKRI